MRCAACGAWNAERAEWCTQCYVPLSDDAAAATPPAPPDDVATSTDLPQGIPATGDVPVGPVAGAPETPLVGDNVSRQFDIEIPDHDGATTARDIRTRDGEVEWRCRVCHGWSVLTDAACAQCGASRHGFGSDESSGAEEPAGAGAVIATVLLPGLGHVVTRRAGAGVARIAIFGLWALGGLVWLFTGGDAARAPAITLLVGAGLLWGLTLVDIVARQSGDREPFGNRGLLWLVVTVTLGLAVAAARVGLELVPS